MEMHKSSSRVARTVGRGEEAKPFSSRALLHTIPADVLLHLPVQGDFTSRTALLSSRSELLERCGSSGEVQKGPGLSRKCTWTDFSAQFQQHAAAALGYLFGAPAFLETRSVRLQASSV